MQIETKKKEIKYIILDPLINFQTGTYDENSNQNMDAYIKNFLIVKFIKNQYQKYFHLHFVGSDLRKSILSQIFNRTSLNCTNRFTLLGFNASKNTSQLMARFNSKKCNGGELKAVSN